MSTPAPSGNPSGAGNPSEQKEPHSPRGAAGAGMSGHRPPAIQTGQQAGINLLRLKRFVRLLIARQFVDRSLDSLHSPSPASPASPSPATPRSTADQVLGRTVVTKEEANVWAKQMIKSLETELADGGADSPRSDSPVPAAAAAAAAPSSPRTPTKGARTAYQRVRQATRFSLLLQGEDQQWYTVDKNCVSAPANGQYLFVSKFFSAFPDAPETLLYCMPDGENASHQIAVGFIRKNVQAAGKVLFENGVVKAWNLGSGTFPTPEDSVGARFTAARFGECTFIPGHDDSLAQALASRPAASSAAAAAPDVAAAAPAPYVVTAAGRVSPLQHPAIQRISPTGGRDSRSPSPSLGREARPSSESPAGASSRTLRSVTASRSSVAASSDGSPSVSPNAAAAAPAQSLSRRRGSKDDSKVGKQ